MTIEEFKVVMKNFGYRIELKTPTHQYLIKDWHDQTIGFVSQNLPKIKRVYQPVTEDVIQQIDHFAGTPLEQRTTDHQYNVAFKPNYFKNFSKLNLNNRTTIDQAYPTKIALTDYQIAILTSLKQQIQAKR